MTSTVQSGVPQQGDLVVRRAHASREVYAVASFGGPSQVTFHTRVDALASARSFAARDKLDVWYTDDGLTFHSIARHRMAS